MHNACGDHSRLITLHRNTVPGFPEDIALNWPLPNRGPARTFRQKKIVRAGRRTETAPRTFTPSGPLERAYFFLTDLLRKPAVARVVRTYDCDRFDIIHYDGGLDFYRYPLQAKKWKKQGKKIVCCYYGSDLRLRGVIKELDALSDLNLTSEYDHLQLKPDLSYIFYPYDPAELPRPIPNESDTIRIVHSPTNRRFKGTDCILGVIEKLKRHRRICFHLLENRSRVQVLEVKRRCDICIDQVGGSLGGTGYGKAGIETLAMGIPTITNMSDDYASWLPENPFVVANDADSLYAALIRLIDSSQLRHELGEQGRRWVHAYHGFESVNQRLQQLYRSHGIIS
jgi:glycosyltransferase involved in cell wall biosynthesis